MHAIAEIGHNNPPSEKELLEQKLKENYKAEAAEFQRLSDHILPTEVKDEKQAGELADYVKAIKSFMSRIAEVHKAEKAVFLECGNVVQKWRNNYDAEANGLISAVDRVLKPFLDKKEEEEAQRRRQIAAKALAEAADLAEEAKAHEAEGIVDTAEELQQASEDAADYATMMSNSAAAVQAKARGVAGSLASTKKPWVGEIISKEDLDLEVLRPYMTMADLDKALKAGVRSGLRKCRGATITQQSKISYR